MKKTLRKGFVTLLITTMLLMTFTPNIAYAAAGLELEKSHEWFRGGYSQVNGVAAGDIDGDNATEIVTVGYFHNYTTTFNEGEADIWNWNNTDLTLERAEYFGPDYTLSFDTRFNDVALGNVDNDTDVEVVIAGYGNLMGVQEQGLLIVGSWNNSAFERETMTYWPRDVDAESMAFGVTLCDVDNDNTTEIITVGYENRTSLFGTGFYGQIAIWNITGGNLVLETSRERIISGDTVWRAVSIDDLDGDGELEIVIVGHFYDTILDHECGMLRVCTWDGSTLEWHADQQWYTYLDTFVYDVAAGDLDSDGIPEIVTIGSQRVGDVFNAQLRMWSWKDDILTLRSSVEGGVVGFFGSTVEKAVAIADVDNDGVNEIVAGIDLSMVFSPMHVTVLSWDGKTLVTEDSKDWHNAIPYKAGNIRDIVACDADDDDVVEIVTAGYILAFVNMTLVPISKLGIWNVSQVASSITVTLSSPSIVIGNQVTIGGAVANETDETPIPNVEVTLESKHDGSGHFTPMGTVTTDENGQYSFTWTPPAAGNYAIKASWRGDFEHEGANDTAALTVEKASSLIALTLSSYTAKVGDTISVNGTLYPAKVTTITIEYALPNGTISIKPVSSNSEGMFSDVFTADQVGEWTVKASWAGDDVYAGTESSPATLEVTKIQSTLSMTALPLTVNLGEDVTISGTLTPGQSATITLKYTMPNGTSITKTDATTSTGIFSDIIELGQEGVWLVKASWTGTDRYEAASSASIAVVAQTVDETTPILAIAGLGLGLVALILAIAGIYVALKKKVGAPPPPKPTEAPPPPPPPPSPA